MDAPATRTPSDPTTIPGWGIDADVGNDPTYPMRDRQNGEVHGLTWPRPPLQPRDVEVLVSIEHNRLPAVFGTPSPPSGLSGGVRRAAFGYSESQWAHWLLLILADRINMVEGLAADLRRGRLPDLLAEYGLLSPRRAQGGAAADRRRTALATVFVAGMGVAILAAAATARRR